MKIAVCIPTYEGHLHLLPRCLASIQAQTRQPDLVVISASSCQSKDIPLPTYSFPIELLVTDRHQLASINRNSAAEYARAQADILTFVDSDDEMVPERLAFLERAFMESHADFVVHSFVTIHSTTQTPIRTVKDYHLYQNSLTVDMRPYCGLIHKEPYPAESRDIHHGHVSIRSTVQERYEAGHIVFTQSGDMYPWEDTEFCRRIALKGYKGAYLSTQLTIYHSYPKLPGASCD